MAFPLLAMLAGAGLGGLKGLGDKEAEEKGWKLKAATTRYSPWTKMEAPYPKRADVMGEVAGGAVGGMLQGMDPRFMAMFSKTPNPGANVGANVGSLYGSDFGGQVGAPLNAWAYVPNQRYT